MKLWWATNPERVDAERSAVESVAQTEGWFELETWRINGLRLSAEGRILAHGHSYPVRLIYPDQFPSVPAWVEPQDPEAHWSIHQYGKGGPLCLELRPDNWCSSANGGDVLRSAYNLLRLESPDSPTLQQEVPSAHHVDQIQSYAWRQKPVLIEAGCLDRIRSGKVDDVRALTWICQDEVTPMLISDKQSREGRQGAPAPDLGVWRFERPVRVVQHEPPPITPTNREELAQALEIDFTDEAETKGGLVVIAAGNDRIVAFESTNADSVDARTWVSINTEAGRRSGRSPDAPMRSVAIIGLGSVGSKVAEMLLRAGIYKMVLVDGDIFFPANLERHALDWRDVGFRKVDAVRRRLINIVPAADILAIAQDLNWQRSAKTYAANVGSIAACDLIIDATGDVATGLMLGALAAENLKPFVSVAIYEGGIGAIIARSIPKRDPSYAVGREAYNAYCDQLNVPPPKTGRRSYEAVTDNEEVLTADDISVTIGAAHAARVALDVLDDQITDSEIAWLLIGCRRGWLFTGHGHVIHLDVGSVQVPPPASEIDAENSFIGELLRREFGDAVETAK